MAMVTWTRQSQQGQLTVQQAALTGLNRLATIGGGHEGRRGQVEDCPQLAAGECWAGYCQDSGLMYGTAKEQVKRYSKKN